MSSFEAQPFGLTDPLGLPRPINVANVFGATKELFADNLFPVPDGFLAHFHSEVFLPYALRVVAALNRHCRDEPRWESRINKDPARYCLTRGGEPVRIPLDLRSKIESPPIISLEDMLTSFDACHAKAEPMPLLDLLTLLREDLGAERFAAAAERHPWIAEFIR